MEIRNPFRSWLRLRAVVYEVSCWPNLRIVCSVVCVLVIAFGILSFVKELVHQRRFHRNKPGPAHSWLLGHILPFAGILRRLPHQIDNQVALALLHRELGFPPVFYLDLYPFADPLLVVADPDRTTTVTVSNKKNVNGDAGAGSNGSGSGSVAGHITQFPRHAMIRDKLSAVLGGRSVTMSKGDEWKAARGVVARAFAPRNISRWTPGLVRIARRFASVLEERAEADGQADVLPVAKVHELCLALMLDMTCLVALGRDLGVLLSTANGHAEDKDGSAAASRGMRIMEAMKAAVNWTPRPSDVVGNMFRWPVYLRHCRLFNGYLAEEVEEFLEQQQQHGEKEKKKADDGRPVSGLEYLVQGYGPAYERGLLSRKEYIATIVDNIKALILGGHDTTASTLSYNYYLLSKNPSTLQTLRAQIDDVVGATASSGDDPDCIGRRIAENPQILNTLPILSPIIEETLRIFPPASAAREAPPGTTILYSDGAEYPVLNHIVFTPHPVLGHSVSLFTEPQKFNPQRYTTTPNQAAPDHAHTPSDTQTTGRGTTESSNWRFFERGQRNCVGRELAMVMLKVAMVMTLSQFDFETAYGEQEGGPGKGNGNGNGKVVDDEFGGPAYQRVESFLPAPNGDLPMRIRKVEM